jgi:hypothetical protein
MTTIEQHVPTSTPREVAAYLKAARALLDAASESRQTWIRELGVLMRSEGPVAEQRALTVGGKQRALFVDLRARLAAIPAPTVCRNAHDAMTSWLDKHVVACDAMIEAGEAGDLGRLRVTQGLLAEARADLSRFNGSFAALVQVLQARAAKRRSLHRRPALSWPFRRQTKS